MASKEFKDKDILRKNSYFSNWAIGFLPEVEYDQFHKTLLYI